MFKEELTPILHSLFQKMEEEGTLPNSLMKLVLPSYQNQTKLQLSFMKTDAKTKYFINRIQQCIKGIVCHDQMGFMPEMHTVSLKL